MIHASVSRSGRSTPAVSANERSSSGVAVTVAVAGGVDDDVAAVPAVAPVGAAERLELLPVHGRGAVAARAGLQVEHHVVDELRHDP